MKILILGANCSRCERLTQNAEEALKKSGLPGEVEKVTDVDVIAGYGVMTIPALVVDDEVVSVGKVLSVTQILSILQR